MANNNIFFITQYEFTLCLHNMNLHYAKKDLSLCDMHLTARKAASDLFSSVKRKKFAVESVLVTDGSTKGTCLLYKTFKFIAKYS